MTASFSIKFAAFWMICLLLAAFARVHFRTIATELAYSLGQLKTTEGKFLEQRSSLRGDLAKLTTKKKLEDLAQLPQDSSTLAKGGQSF